MRDEVRLVVEVDEPFGTRRRGGHEETIELIENEIRLFLEQRCSDV